MSAARDRRSAHNTPATTPTPARPSDDAVRRVIERRNAARIEELETENATLQAQLEEALTNCQQHDEQQAKIEESEAQLAAMKQKYERLERSHEELVAKLIRHDTYVQKANQKYKAAKENAIKWKEYADKHLGVQRNTSKKPQGLNTSRLPADPSPSRDASDMDVTPTPLHRTPLAEVKTTDQVRDAQNEPNRHAVDSSQNRTSDQGRNPSSSGPQPDRITSSQTTEDDQQQAPTQHIKSEPCSDEEPVIVRETNLKRRRGESPSAVPARRVKQEPESPERPGSAKQPVELGSDDYSAPASRTRPVVRTETSDLDALQGSFHTPRKRRLLYEPRALSEDRTRSSFRPPIPLARNSSSLSENDVAEPTNPSTTSWSTEDATKHNENTTIKQENTPTTRSQARQRGALQQLSPNVPSAKATKKRQHASNDDTDKVGIIAEDGDETTSQITPKAGDKPTKTPVSHRLDAMLENPASGRQPLKPRQPPSSTKRKPPQKPTTTPNNQPNLIPSPPPVDPSTAPLRIKPLHHLTPQDFRLNPAATGSTYAYADPLNRHSKAARRCLPGCIDPSCCGQFLEAARSGTLPPSSKTDSQVLEAMLGPGYEAILAAYPPAEHGEVLIQARAQEFANAHGRHRKRFERAKTPPGFWRTDMPSTQEEREDRARAEEMERRRVEGMWREAMRGDGMGRWKFRDE